MTIDNNTLELKNVVLIINMKDPAITYLILTFFNPSINGL